VAVLEITSSVPPVEVIFTLYLLPETADVAPVKVRV
jgi:hypothetical protein